jgi:Carboxypeptidase regulatory-like domain
MARRIATTVLLLLIAVTAVEGQTGRITGRVLDNSGAPIPGVTITVVVGRQPRSTVTDDEGRFSIPVPSGVYTVTAEMRGFATFRQPNVRVVQGQSASLTISIDTPILTAPPPPPTGGRRAPPPEPPPPPPPPPLPPPLPSNPPSESKTSFWNSWVVDTQSPSTTTNDPLKVGGSYIIAFDISPYMYEAIAAGAASTVPDPALGDALRRAARVLKVRVQAVLGGSGLTFSPTEQLTKHVEFQTDRLRNPGPQYQTGENFLDYQRRVTAGTMQIEVEADSPGCAAVAFSIWTDTNTPKPLDYVSRRVVIADANGRQPDCAVTTGFSQSKPMTAEIVTLLSTDLGAVPDAALHVFQLKVRADSDDVTSNAVFVSRDRPSLAWRLTEDLSRFLVDQNSLLREVSTAHDGNGYSPLMRRLTDVIFPDTPDAKAALATLRDLPTAGGRPTVFARLVDKNGTAGVLPLGLIDSGSGEPFGARVDVVEPLPREVPANQSACVSNWTFVLPSSLASDVGSTSICTAPAPPTTAVRQWDLFKQYLQTPVVRPNAAEGLLLLAHHAGGSISFDNTSPEYVRSSELSRLYAPGSVAMVVACNVAASVNQYGADSWLTKINSAGVDAEIVSPFDVPADFGACLARHFANEVELARQGAGDVTLVDLFRQASAKVRGDYAQSDSDKDKKLADAVYEFVLAGDGQLKMCPR